MVENSTNSKPLGICSRLFYFFTENLMARSLKRVSFGKPAEESRVSLKDEPNSDIQIQFKQTEGLISGNHWSRIPDSRTREFPYEMVIPLVQGNGAEHSNIKSDAARTNKKGEKSNLDSESKASAGKKNKTSHDNSTLLVQPEELKGKSPRRIIKPVLLDVAPNINEKSDAYIRSMKEKLSRN